MNTVDDQIRVQSAYVKIATKLFDIDDRKSFNIDLELFRVLNIPTLLLVNSAIAKIVDTSEHGQ